MFWILSRLPIRVRYSVLYFAFSLLDWSHQLEKEKIFENAKKALSRNSTNDLGEHFFRDYCRHQASAIAFSVSIVCGGVKESGIYSISGLNALPDLKPKLILLDHFGSFGASSLLLSALHVRTACVSYVDANSWYTKTWEPVVQRYFPGYSNHRYIETPSRNWV